MSPLEYAKRIAYSSEETLIHTYDMAKRFKDAPGVFVETGVAAGAQIIMMAHACPRKVIYAFDSFQGIPYPSNRDDQMPGIKFLSKVEREAWPDPGKGDLVTSGATVVPERDFWDHIEKAIGTAHYIKTVKGWFENTTIGFDQPIALLRLDGDLYNSTFVCLQNLFPLVLKDSVVIIDDFGLPGCRDACKEYFESIKYEPRYKTKSDTTYFFK